MQLDSAGYVNPHLYYISWFDHLTQIYRGDTVILKLSSDVTIYWCFILQIIPCRNNYAIGSYSAIIEIYIFASRILTLRTL